MSDIKWDDVLESAANDDAVDAAETVEAEIIEEEGSVTLNLTGHEASVLMYYLDQGQVLLLVSENRSCKVLYGYDKDGKALLYNPKNGKEETEEFSKMVERCDKDSVSVYTRVVWNDVKS